MVCGNRSDLSRTDDICRKDQALPSGWASLFARAMGRFDKTQNHSWNRQDGEQNKTHLSLAEDFYGM